MWLIRHGESESNVGGRFSDPQSIPLTVRGHQQAERVAETFVTAPALVVTSPYLRARQTAQPTLDRFPDVACHEWPVQEFTYLGELHGQVTTTEEREPYVRAYWARADPHHANGRAESFADLFHRAQDCLNRLAEQGSGPVVIFSHGQFMKAVVWLLLTGNTTADSEAMRNFHGFADRYHVPNCGVAELRYTDRGPAYVAGGLSWRM